MKHKFSRVFSGILACCMAVLIMPLQAEAAGGPTYDVYQIFTGGLAIGEEGSDHAGETVMTDVKWGLNGTGTEGEAPDEAILEELSGIVGKGDKAGLDVIAKYVDLGSAAFMSGLDLSELSTVTAPVGYYYICNTPGSVGPNDGYTAGVTVVSSEDGTFEVVPKAGSVSLTKGVTNLTKAMQNRLEHTLSEFVKVDRVADGSSGLVVRKPFHSVAAEQGDSIGFTVNLEYPENMGAYKNFYVDFEDVLPHGLALVDDSVTVTWYMTPQVTGLDGKQVSAVRDGSASDPAVFTVSRDDTRLNIVTRSQLGENGSFAHSGGDRFFYGIQVRYECKVTDAAAVSAPNTNQVMAKWSNDPSELPYGPGPVPEHLAETIITDDTKASVWTPGLIMHLESKSGNPIANARFELARTDAYENADGESVTRTITECSIRTPVFSQDQAGQYAPLQQDGKYTWVYNMFSGDGLPEGTVRYDVRDNSPVASTGSGVLSLTTDENGMMVVTGLPCGTYRLHLVEDVKGYNKLDDIEFNIEPLVSGGSSLGRDQRGGEIEGFQVTLPGGVLPAGLQPNVPYHSDNWAYVNMQLMSGLVLPTTGGPGVAGILLAGAAVVILAGALLYRKRRVA